MLRSMYAGVSGLNAHQQMMDVTGNNISNVNTVGFKSSRVTFKEMLSQTIQGASAPQDGRAGTNPQQVGLGVGLGSIDTDMSSGNLQSTGKTSDVAIQGDGFFVLRDGNSQVYSRAGNLNFDEQGRLYSSSTGMLVQGWEANDNGKFDGFNAQEIDDITLKQEIDAVATDKIEYGKNLNANAVNDLEIVEQNFSDEESLSISRQTGSSFNKWDYTLNDSNGNKITSGTIKLNPDGTIASDKSIAYDKDGDGTDDYKFTTMTSGGEEFLSVVKKSDSSEAVNFDYTKNAKRNMSVSAFDSQGTKHSVNLELEKTDFNNWQIGNFTVDGIKGDPTLNGVKVTNNDASSIKSTEIIFNKNGTVKSGGTHELTFTPSGTANTNNSEQTVELDFSDITQYSGDMTANFSNVNGNQAGALESFSFTETGDVVGSYDNGLTQTLAKLGLATFSNPAGLSRKEGVFEVTSNSGDPELGAPAQGGFGSLAPATLEMSNASLSKEFTNMITAQRGFQANSKLITTSDEMLQTLVNLKR